MKDNRQNVTIKKIMITWEGEIIFLSFKFLPWEMHCFKVTYFTMLICGCKFCFDNMKSFFNPNCTVMLGH